GGRRPYWPTSRRRRPFGPTRLVDARATHVASRRARIQDPHQFLDSRQLAVAVPRETPARRTSVARPVVQRPREDLSRAGKLLREIAPAQDARTHRPRGATPLVDAHTGRARRRVVSRDQNDPPSSAELRVALNAT